MGVVVLAVTSALLSSASAASTFVHNLPNAMKPLKRQLQSFVMSFSGEITERTKALWLMPIAWWPYDIPTYFQHYRAQYWISGPCNCNNTNLSPDFKPTKYWSYISCQNLYNFMQSLPNFKQIDNCPISCRSCNFVQNQPYFRLEKSYFLSKKNKVFQLNVSFFRQSSNFSVKNQSTFEQNRPNFKKSQTNFKQKTETF